MTVVPEAKPRYWRLLEMLRRYLTKCEEKACNISQKQQVCSILILSAKIYRSVIPRKYSKRWGLHWSYPCRGQKADRAHERRPFQMFGNSRWTVSWGFPDCQSTLKKKLNLTYNRHAKLPPQACRCFLLLERIRHMNYCYSFKVELAIFFLKTRCSEFTIKMQI